MKTRNVSIKDTDAPAKCAITLKKAHISVKKLWNVTQIELDLCFYIIYQQAKYEKNRYSLSKVIERTPIFVLCFYKRPITPSKISGL